MLTGVQAAVVRYDEESRTVVYVVQAAVARYDEDCCVC